MLACIPFAWVWMLPDQMEDFLQSLFAVSLFASNVLFNRQSGYFDTAAEEKPLLHTWSLAVEEQYYIIFPILLFFIWRERKDFAVWIIVCLGAISLAYSEWGWRNQPTANFYLSPGRAWELLIGSLAAIIVQKRGVRSNEIFAIAGMLAIIVSLFVFDHTTPFPSIYTLLPCIGVMSVLIFGGQGTLTAKLLGNRVFVGVGLISFSAYLWHQPLFAFMRIRFPEHANPISMLGLSLLALILAYFSWRYIERPFRKPINFEAPRFTMLKSSILWFVVFFAFGLGGYFSNGYENRLNEAERQYIKDLQNEYTAEYLDSKHRTAFANDGRRKLLIIGDSYAKDLVEGIVGTFGSDFKTLDVVTLNVARRCKNVLQDTPDLDDYLMPSDVHCFGDYHRIGSSKFDEIIRAADLTLVRSLWDVLPTREMPRTYDYLNTIAKDRVGFIGGQMFGTFQINSRNSLASPKKFAFDVNTKLPYTHQPTNLTSIDLFAEAEAIMGGRNYFSVSRFFCDKSHKCKTHDEHGQPLTSDGAHLTLPGEIFRLRQLFQHPQFKDLWVRNLELVPAL